MPASALSAIVFVPVNVTLTDEPTDAPESVIDTPASVLSWKLLPDTVTSMPTGPARLA